MQTNSVILFDGICNLCAWSVRFIIKHDPKGYFKFVSLQSASGRRLVASQGISERVDSFILIDGDRYLTKSSAAIRISQHLSGFWRFLAFLSIIPQPSRDWIYDLIASHRYKLFGKIDACPLPGEVDINRFLD
jgi:predicted DCC family thiol-disulfide oxidoreductase YuxK